MLIILSLFYSLRARSVQEVQEVVLACKKCARSCTSVQEVDLLLVFHLLSYLKCLSVILYVYLLLLYFESRTYRTFQSEPFQTKFVIHQSQFIIILLIFCFLFTRVWIIYFLFTILFICLLNKGKNFWNIVPLLHPLFFYNKIRYIIQYM